MNSLLTDKDFVCERCSLYKNCKSPRMNVYGKGRKRIFLLGEAPGEIEDMEGKPWQGKAGKKLKETLRELEIDLFEDCWSLNAVNCRPTEGKENRTPTSKEIKYCRERVFREIKKLKPKAIFLFGISAVTSIIGVRWENIGTISKWRGWVIPDQELQCFLIPVFHPSYIEREKETNPIVEKIWKQDLKRGLEALTNLFPTLPPPRINIIDNPATLKGIRTHIKKAKQPIAIDYETTGIKPDAEGHKIICASLALNEYNAFVFLMTKEMESEWKEILGDEEIKKIGHNIKYEETWSRVILKQSVKGWIADTMITAHILDNRPEITGLKFQSYVYFGVGDYSSSIVPYLQSSENHGNGKNKLEVAINDLSIKTQLLKYCALDTIYTYMLYKAQIEKLKEYNLVSAYNFFHEGVLTLCDMEREGIKIDKEYLETEDLHISKRIQRLENKFYDSPLYREWRKAKKDKEINIYSNTQLSEFLYKIKRIKPVKLTYTGQGSTDEEALLNLNIEELRYLVEIRKMKKIKETYIKGFLDEQVNGIIHPSFNLHLVTTYRSSCDHPNFQNLPKRDEKLMRIIRGSIYPSKNNVLLEADYSSLEVRIAACYHKDPTMIKYLKDPESDMHADLAEQIFLLKLNKHIPEHKYLRYVAKNGFVFPEFYGSYYKSCAWNIAVSHCKLSEGKWKKGEGVEIEKGYYLSDYLISKGIKSYNDFVEHIEEIENHFWNVRFPVYKKWKGEWYKRYLRRGYIKMYTGFRCSSIMTKNDAINYPIQGSAFHCLLWSLIQLNKEFKRKEYKSRIVGQIHDSILFDVVPEELKEIKEITRRITCQELPKQWDWIVVPLDIEFEVTQINQSWANKKEIYESI